LLGVDTLIVLDEAHLVPAFERTLARVKEIHAKYPQLKPFHVMFLSATLRRKKGDVFTWSPEDLKNEIFKRRVEAKKILKLHRAENVRQEIIRRALNYRGQKARVAIFVHKPEDAAGIAKSLKEKIGEEKVILLTGQIRGYERDKLTEKETFKSFLLGNGSKAGTEECFFVATSAGEIGIDLDADFCICDLTTMDSLIQRWGRVNRSGRENGSLIELVYTEDEGYFEGPLGEAKKATLEFLKTLEGRDVSPASLARLRIPKEAFSPVPFSPDLTESELELWAMTSVPDSELEPRDWYRIEYWLHGSEEEEPETFLLWRDDIHHLSACLEEEEKKRIEGLLTSFYRPLSKEKLRVPTSELRKFLGKAEEKLEKKGFQDLKAIVMTSSGLFICRRIRNLREEALEFATVFLPSEVGGLNEEGYLDLESIGEKAKDVADEVVPEKEERMRLLFEWGEGECRIVRLGGASVEEFGEKPGSYRELESYLGKRYRDWSWRKFVTKREGDEPTQCLVYLRKRPEEPEDLKTKVPILLQQHEREVETLARNICNKLGLERKTVEAISLAALCHDEGKRNIRFQKEVLRNTEPSPKNLWAKSVETGSSRKFGFRHEIGSLLLAMLNHIDEDLILHLIASSHGRSRPLFKEEDFTFADEEYIGFDIPHRITSREVMRVKEQCPCIFSNLQRKYGYWNLAYLESLLKAADVIASKKEIEKT
jgi:CRISPR-associated endonuclease/helicase Cas3